MSVTNTFCITKCPHCGESFKYLYNTAHHLYKIRCQKCQSTFVVDISPYLIPLPILRGQQRLRLQLPEEISGSLEKLSDETPNSV